MTASDDYRPAWGDEYAARHLADTAYDHVPGEGGTRYLGWSLAPSGARVPEAAGPLYRGPLTGWLARAALPDPAADPGGEAEATRLAREVEDYLASARGLDGPDTTTTTT